MLFDFSQIAPQDAYKLVVSSVVPRPIAWVVTQDAAGVVNAAPYSFFNAFSDNPVVVGIGCGPKAPGALKDTAANIKETGQFTVCLVPEQAIHAMNATAVDFAPEVDELKEAGLTALPSAKIRPPRIAESPVALECETFQLVPAGRHTIVLGKVLAIHIKDDCVLDAAKCYVDTPKLNLVGRMHGRGWYTRTTDRLEVPRMTVAEWEAKKKAAE
ncbi:flavin reductase family protein [Siccirubricoccus sp. KC 17139]|uniref:Flavin reductase family protein n=1 Tax=Siccirubricoccus soli TaxID=2899147 RepID=A0ABT1DBS9_9PROT|nr:flavin reductase family protein [Siccirubricoccus soli]MCO6418619.1 flavin reductase family protein [Siccirubricoccus soli]MCP2684754.1 flavin reductase family protein [Siccirubricoccus soli]